MKSKHLFARNSLSAALTLNFLFILLSGLSMWAKAPIPITACTTISKSGSYVVTANLSAASTCLQITADFVTLHLAGHSVFSVVDALSATSVKNLSIIGPGSFSSSSYGIELINVTNSQVVGVKSSGDFGGIHIHNDAGISGHNRVVASKVFSSSFSVGILADSQGNTYLGNEVCGAGTLAGISVSGGQGDLIEGNLCSPVTAIGFSISGTHESIVGNTADNGKGASSVGIYVDGTDNLIHNNEASGNKANDLVDHTGACGNNTWTANAFGTANLSCIN